MALDTISTARLEITKIYIAAFNRAPDAAGLSNWMNQYTSGTMTYAQISQDFSNQTEYTTKYPSAMTNSEYITKIYTNVFGRSPDAGGLQNWVNQLDASAITGATRGNIMKTMLDAAGATGNTDGLRLTNQATFAVQAVVIDGVSDVTATAQLANITSDAATVTTATAAVASAINAGTTYSLTTGTDDFTGTALNDTFSAGEGAAGAATLTVGDTINGGAGTDTLNFIETDAITRLPVGSTLTSVEILNVIGGAAVTIDTTTGVTGLTDLNVTNEAANQTITAAATQNVTSVVTAQAAADVIVNGGKAVSVTGTGVTAVANITIGGTTAAASTVAASSTATFVNNSANDFTMGAHTITGGTTVTSTQSAGLTASNTTAALADATNGEITQGAVTVTGDANTTAVTVTQDSAQSDVDTAGIGRIGIVNGAVTISDANQASTTLAGTITTATVTGGAIVTIESGALTTLNLGGTITSVDADDLGSLTTAANTTLALNATGLVTTGAVVIDTDITTLNLSGNTTASTIATLDIDGVITLNVSGDAKVTATAQADAALTSVVVTNTAGLSLGTALATAVAFTGGAGDDSILIGSTTKAITLGAGNDTVTTSSAAVGTGGSVAAGAGTADKIIMTDALAAGADASPVFNTKFTGFEVLEISDALVEDGLDLDGLNAVSTVILAAGATTATLTNLVSGGTVQFNDTNSTGTTTITVKSALLTAADVLNLVISNSGDVYAAATVNAANVETINIAAADAATAADATTGSAAAINTLTLAATSATSVVVTGNNGLTLGNTGNVAITNFDASGIVANDTAAIANQAATTDTAVNLAVTFASTNVTASAAVTIKGGAGNDTLTGTIAKDTISGNAGIDYIYSDNAGTKRVDTFTVTTNSSGAETGIITILGEAISFADSTTGDLTLAAANTAIQASANYGVLFTSGITVVTTGTSGLDDVLTITYLVDGNTVSSGDFAGSTGVFNGGTAGAATAATQVTAGTAGTTAVDVIDGGAGADVLVGGGGADTITTGAGADTIFMLQAHSVLAAAATITDYTYAVDATSNDTLTIGDVTTIIGTTLTVQDLSAQTTLALALGAAAATNTVDAGLSVFIWGGDEYVYVETTGSTTTYAATDTVVKLTGLPLASGDAIAGAGFDAV